MPGWPYAASRPASRFESLLILPHSAIPAEQLRLSGPSEKLDAAHWPVRGDLAHVSLAGRCFVPHYAVPMGHVVTKPATLARAPGGDAVASLASGANFDVLDISGGWCWGQAVETGLVGYLPQDALASA